MFLGQYHTKLSNKNRTAIPARFRRELGDKIIISRWYEKSLAVWSSESWERILNIAVGGSLITRPTRDTERFLLGGAIELELDAQGRVVLPEVLVSYAQVSEEIVFVGIKERIEIWSKKNWEEQEARIIARAEELIETVQKEKKWD